MKVRMERVAPILPVRDVTAALAHYRQLGFEVQAYGPPGEANPEYGFVRRGDVELHLSLPRSTTPRSRRATATSMSAMPTPSMPPGRPPMLPAVFGRPGTRRTDCVSLHMSIPRATCFGGSPLQKAEA